MKHPKKILASCIQTMWQSKLEIELLTQYNQVPLEARKHQQKQDKKTNVQELHESWPTWANWKTEFQQVVIFKM